VGRKLHHRRRPEFGNDAEANKLISREVYRKPYIV
jgi:hypothetical protein